MGPAFLFGPMCIGEMLLLLREASGGSEYLGMHWRETFPESMQRIGGDFPLAGAGEIPDIGMVCQGAAQAGASNHVGLAGEDP
jgi:hypothetical protein